MNITQEVTNEYPESAVNNLIENVVDEYGVSSDDVFTDIDYEISGNFILENVDPTQANLVEDTIRNSISQQAGVPFTDVEVNFDTDTGVVEYKVKTDIFDETNNIKDQLYNDQFTTNVESSLENIDSNINLSSPEVSDKILADINIVVDTEDVMKNASDRLSQELSTDGFTVEKTEGIFRL